MAPKRVYYRCKDDGLKEAPDLVKVDVDVNNLCWSFLTGSAVYSVYLITSTFFITSPNDVGPLFIFVFLRPYVFCGWQSRQDNNNEGKEGMKREKKKGKNMVSAIIAVCAFAHIPRLAIEYGGNWSPWPTCRIGLYVYAPPQGRLSRSFPAVRVPPQPLVRWYYHHHHHHHHLFFLEAITASSKTSYR